MGMEYVCRSCRRPIGANQFTSLVAGYCVQCSANMQMRAQLDSVRNMNPRTAPTEKEVFGETIREVPLIEHDENKS